MSELDEFINMRPEERPTLPPGVRPEEIRAALQRAKRDDEARAAQAAEAASTTEPVSEPTMSLPDTPITDSLHDPEPTDAEPQTADRSALVFAAAVVATVLVAAFAALGALTLFNGLLAG